MRTKRLIVISIISIIFLSLIYMVQAQTVAPGVSVGEVYNYNYNATWSSTNPNAQTPDYIEDFTRIQSFQIEITGVSGTIINAEITTKYADGSSQKETGFVDVQLGSIHLPFGYLIIPSNLNVNDKIYPLGGDATINSTTTRTYSYGQRQILTYLIEETYASSYGKTEYSFDKIKGIAVDYNFISRETVGSYTETFRESIVNTDSDVWTTATAKPSSTATITSNPTANNPTTTNFPVPTSQNQNTLDDSTLILIVVLFFVIIIVLVGILLLMKGRKKRSRVDAEFAKYMKPQNS